jgi:hypothetical protein
MEDSSRFAKSRLTQASRAKRRAKFLAAGFGTAAIVLVLVLSVALLDYWLMLVPSVRIAGLAVLSLFVIGGIFQVVRILRRPTPLKEAALDAEAATPEIGCELSTAAEYLSGERKPAQEYENELAAALEDKAATHLTKVRLPYMQRAVRPALVVAALLLAALIFGVVASGGLTAFQRTVLPWLNASYSQVKVLPGDVEIPVGRDLEVKSIFSGRIPRTARFQWQDEGNQQWQFAVLTRNAQGEYNYPLKNVRTSLKYRVSGSDAVSPEFKIQPYLPAEVKDWKIDLEYPAYTKRAKISQTKPEITTLRGSIASIEIAPNVKLSSAKLKFKDGPVLDLKPQANGFWKVDLKIEKDTEFQVELADEKGRPGQNEASYAIKATPDEIPLVEIAEPAADIRAASTNTIPIKIKAMDDYGLDEIKLVYHKLGGPEEFITATRNGETNTEFVAELNLSPLGLQEYELVAYHALAKDNNTLDGPGIGKSDVFFIEITDKEGGACKMQGKPGDKVNLLVVQKQIIADTAALATNATPEKLDELAKRQADAIEFGRIYQKALGLAGTNAAVQEMTAAVTAMEAAHAALQIQNAKIALPPEEKALASLYQVIRLMPELQDLPIVPPTPPEKKPEEEKKDEEKKEEEKPPLMVVLEEIKKQKEEQPENQEIAEALEEAKRLQDEQAALNIGIQNPAQGTPSGAPLETQIDRSGPNDSEKKDAPKQMAKADTQAESKAEAEAKGEGQGKGEPTAEAKAKKEAQKKAAAKKAAAKKAAAKSGKAAKPGSKPGKGTQPGKGENPAKDGQPSEKPPGEKPQPGEKTEPAEKSPDEPAKPETADALAEKQSELTEEAKELAEKLERLAGKDSRVGHGAPGKMRTAASNMQKVTDALGKGDTENAGTQGAQAAASLEAAIAMLENALAGRPERVDVSKEVAPKQFEAVISEYFKALSYDK